MYLDQAPFLGAIASFRISSDRMDWIQPPENYLLAVVCHEGVLQISGVSQPFGKDSALIFPPGARCRITRTDSGFPGAHWWFNFRPSDTGQFKVALSTVTPVADTVQFWNPMMKRGFDMSPYTRTTLQATMWNLLWTISENAAKVSTNSTLEAVEKHIVENLAGQLPISELADLAGLSHNHLIRVFRSEHGMTPTEYIRAERMNRACHLILSSEMSFKQIGVAVGYPNPQHFHNIIKQTFGCSPQDIRSNRSIPKIFF